MRLRIHGPGLLGFTLALLAPVLHAQPVGGGVLHGGWQGHYFANPDLAGTPAFVRRDVRIAFEWGNPAKPGGSRAPGFANVGPEQFSVIWEGEISPRFTESYTFHLRANDGARLWLRLHGQGSFQPIIDAWSQPGLHTGTSALAAGERYDVRLEYRQLTGIAEVVLDWSSPSTPQEVLEAATLSALNVDTYAAELWANAMDGGRDEWRDATFSDDPALWPARDASGWPLGDAETIVWEGRNAAAMAGRYTLQFRGRAQVTTQFGYGRFFTGETDHGYTLPFAAGWDPASNLTTATMEVAGGEILFLEFTQTRRQPSDTVPTGVSQVRLMRPLTPGSPTAHAVGARFHEDTKRAFGRYTTLRWILNFERERTWSERVQPDYSSHAETGTRRHWELMIQLANETGKDLYLCLPHGADDDYVSRVARMIRYGSDGVNPYEAPQADPAFAPLNPNLRVYVERGNEIWNWSFSQAGENAADGQREVLTQTANGSILNFDGANPRGDNFNRWHALRTVQMSELFRAVWGDQAMGDRVRFLLEYQYDNAQGTAEQALDFLDRYFNNADGQSHVPVPRPVRHFIWGGGGAVYYGSGNAQGTQDAIVFREPGLEAPVLAAGESRTAPLGSAWTFSGPAGLYRRADRVDALSAGALGPAGNDLPGPRSLGFRFTTGGTPVAVYELGRQVLPGNNRPHTIRLIRVNDRALLAETTVETQGAAAGAMRYAALPLPIPLEAHSRYDLVSEEVPGLDSFHDATTVITPDASLTVDGPVTAMYGNPSWDTGTWTFSFEAAPDHGFGPLGLRTASVPVGELGFPPDPPEGAQGLWLAGTGAASQVVNFTQPGHYALRFQAAAKLDRETGVQFFVDDENITPNGTDHSGPSTSHWVPGSGWARNYRVYENNGSFVFPVNTPGERTLRIQASGLPRYYGPGDQPDPTRHVYFDRLEVVSVEAIFTGGIPGAGEANGQVAQSNYAAQLNSQARYAQTFGLKVVAYEGGWSLGGDFGSVPIQNWAKFRHPLARQAQLDSANLFAQSGGAVYTYGTYSTWPGEDTTHSDAYPLAQAVDTFNAVLPPEAGNGFFIPAVLRPPQSTWSLRSVTSTGQIAEPGGWFSWNVLAPVTGVWEVVIETSGTGEAGLDVDGLPTGLSFAAGSTEIRSLDLPRGLHTLRLRALAGTFSVTRLTIRQPQAPEPPVVQSLTDGDGSITIAWTPAAAGAAPTAYLLRVGTSAGRYDREIALGLVGQAEIASLANNQTYYIVVVAQGDGGFSLPSAERAATPMAPGIPGVLAQWDFAAYRGTETEGPATSTTSRVVVSPLHRGPGFMPTTYGTDIAGGSFSSEVNNGASASLGQALSKGHFVEFTIRPVPGFALSLSSIRFLPYWQNESGAAGLALSTDGTTFSVVPADGQVNWRGSPWVADLASLPELQQQAAPVTIRLLMWGVQTWQFSGIGVAPGNDIEVTGAFALATEAAPSLTILRTAGGLEIRWTGMDYQLQSCLALPPAGSWAGVGDAPQADGDGWRWTTMPAETARYFRLVRP